jgi:hypothetical protein
VTPLKRLTDAHIVATCNRLAELLRSEDGRQTFYLLNSVREAQDAQAATANFKRHPNQETGQTQIGIWQRDQNDSNADFVRISPRSCSGDLTMWANAERIKAKGPRKRVVLLGESVARGHFYDPHYTPAAVLESMLPASCREGANAEVIDLACTAIGAEPLMSLIDSSVALNPDAMVVFAGNNWAEDSLLSWDEVQKISSLVQDSGDWHSLQEYREKKLVSRTDRFLEHIGNIVRRHSIPVVVVLPEFNLVDWTDHANVLPRLKKGKTAKWVAARGEALAALEANNYRQAATIAREMVDLDGGTSPSSFRLLAEAKRRTHRNDEARELYERSRDAVLSHPTTSVPRCYSSIQTRLRAAVADAGATLIDLPHRFKQYLAGELPDRRLFLDYCHLSAEGIEVAMRAIATTLTPILGYQTCSNGAAALVPQARVTAMASFLAACHNHSWGQGYDIVRYHCWEALRQDPDVADRMSEYVDFQTRAVSLELCRSFASFVNNEPTAFPYHLKCLFRERGSQRKLIDAIVDVCSKPRADMKDTLAKLRSETHGLSNKSVDLLDKYYADDPLMLQDVTRCYHRSYIPESAFFFVTEISRPIRLLIAYRMPSSTDIVGTATIKLNGYNVTELPHNNEWTRKSLTISSEWVHQGANTLTVTWPIIERDWNVSLEEFAARSDSVPRVRFAEKLFPPCGEISELVVAAASEEHQAMNPK